MEVATSDKTRLPRWADLEISLMDQPPPHHLRLPSLQNEANLIATAVGWKYAVSRVGEAERRSLQPPDLKESAGLNSLSSPKASRNHAEQAAP